MDRQSCHLRQAVTIPTHQSGSILDLIFTNLTDFYYAPRSLRPLLNSDHFIIFWEASSAIPKPKRVKYTVRPLTEDSISTFGCWIGNYQFEDICSEQDINIKVNKLNTLLQEQFQTCFPVKVITRAKRQYVRDKITPLLTIDPHKWHSSVKRLTGKTTLRDLRLLKEDGTLTSANEVNSFFADICTSFPSITKSEIDTIIAGEEIEDVCEVSEFTVYKKLLRLKANCASYPGELPVKLLREFAIFLAKPLSSIINQCFLQQVFPSAWKRAYVRVIPKVRCPKSCDQLRPISITPNLSKVAESFIYRKLVSQVSAHLDPYQYGCLRGSSTTVYLVRMYHLIVEWLDRGSAIVDLLLVDYRKAFDLIRHSVAITNLRTMDSTICSLSLVLDFTAPSSKETARAMSMELLDPAAFFILLVTSLSRVSATLLLSLIL
ncbi:uncharacterized protein LOC136029743 [Artemia franciscana]|uniref:uncharacterized protein LOC136029743 n=1 Tax=Artemia franciscana TaxID=6661 RepID=UPI0032DA2B2A